MFHTPLELNGKRGQLRSLSSVFALLEPISRAKYPDLTHEEEAISLPLQVLCLAIFDAVLVHMLHTVAPRSWQRVKRTLHCALYKDRVESCLGVLRRTYSNADVICLQEVSGDFVERLRHGMPGFAVVEPAHLDRARNQNSVIALRAATFDLSTLTDVTSEVLEGLGSITGAADLVVAAVDGHHAHRYLVASFHSDSCGLATIPVLSAIHRLTRTKYPAHRLILGLDANTFSAEGAAAPSAAAADHEAASCPLSKTRSCPDVVDFRRTASSCPVNSAASFFDFFSGLGMASCWGREGHLRAWTTCNARTFLQPQLQKAVALRDALSANHCHLKDWVLFYEDQLTASHACVDNTGARRFAQRVFPAQDFPSDHAAVSVRLAPAPPPSPYSSSPRTDDPPPP
mmetsp:Transcript_67483/g.180301  ORF Transcript_67483/g.180301 Transcript_67483/m.180301 type:complete len:400 (+) Transcript_67483:82-1281(+)